MATKPKAAKAAPAKIVRVAGRTITMPTVNKMIEVAPIKNSKDPVGKIVFSGVYGTKVGRDKVFRFDGRIVTKRKLFSARKPYERSKVKSTDIVQVVKGLVTTRPELILAPRAQLEAEVRFQLRESQHGPTVGCSEDELMRWSAGVTSARIMSAIRHVCLYDADIELNFPAEFWARHGMGVPATKEAARQQVLTVYAQRRLRALLTAGTVKDTYNDNGADMRALGADADELSLRFK